MRTHAAGYIDHSVVGLQKAPRRRSLEKQNTLTVLSDGATRATVRVRLTLNAAV